MGDTSPALRVALVAGSYQPDRCGVAHYTHQLRSVLATHGIRSVVLTDRESAADAHDRTVRGVVRGWRLRDMPRLAAAIRAVRPDVVHVQHAAGTYDFRRGIFALPLLLRGVGSRAPIVTTAHEYGWWEWRLPGGLDRGVEWLKEVGQRHGWWDREDGVLLTGSRAIVVTNADAERIVHARLPMLAERVHRVPIGINVEVASHDRSAARRWLQATLGWPPEAPVIAFFGFLHPVKGVETLFEAFRVVRITEPAARLLLVGGVESLALRADAAARYWRELHTRAEDLTLAGALHMTGYVPAERVSRYLTGADIGVLPFNAGVTLKSGSLLALLAHALPVIATERDAPDHDLPRAALHLVPPRDPARLARALTDLLATPDAGRRMGEVGREFAHRFSWPAIAARHIDIYRHVCAGSYAAGGARLLHDAIAVGWSGSPRGDSRPTPNEDSS